jgi:outer membrane protein TolC
MESQQQNMELSSKVARVAKIKYEQGVGSNLEVIESVNSLKESQVNYYNAMYDAIVTKVDLDKAYGKLLPQTQSN